MTSTTTFTDHGHLLDVDHEPESPARTDPSRRDLLSGRWSRAALIAAAGVGLAACDLVSAPFDADLHLLRRATYGPTPDLLEEIETMGSAAWLDAQLHPQTLDTTAVDALLAQLPALDLPPAQLFQQYPNTNTANAAGAQLKLAWLIRAVHSPAQLFERMVEFWSDHLNVPQQSRFSNLTKIVEDRQVIRPHALGRFKDLLAASAASPAMLDYLDNARSSAGAINENYARELLELHTLGVDGGYTETDIVNTARLLTGWSVLPAFGVFLFRAGQHDTSPLSILGWQRPTDTEYFDHGVQFLHYLAERPATASFVCTKLAVRFVGDDPDPALVNAMAQAWLANDTEIVPVLETMFAHPAFAAAAGTKLRRPLDYLAATLRAAEANVVPTTDLANLTGLGGVVGALGQIPFGWPAPNGFPDVEGAWLNTGALLNRWRMTGLIIDGAFNSVLALNPADFVAAMQGLTAEEIYAAAAERLTFEQITTDGAQLLANRTGWPPGQIPPGNQFTTGLATVAYALLTAPDVMYR